MKHLTEEQPPPTGGLRRQLGLLGLAATGICSMVIAYTIVPFLRDDADKALMWGRWQKGESLNSVGTNL